MQLNPLDGSQKHGIMRLPANMQKHHKLKTDFESIQKSNTLYSIYSFFCDRFVALGMQIDKTGQIFLEDQKMSVNGLYTMLRKDLLNAGFAVNEKVAKHIIECAIQYTVQEAKKVAIAQDGIVKLA